MFKFLINNYDYTSEITNFPEINQEVNYNASLSVWTETLPSTFIGSGSLYSMLFARMLAGQFCESLDIVIKKLDNADAKYYTIFEGKILMSDLTWRMSVNEVDISLVNNDWQTKIENNYEVPVPMDAKETKSSNQYNLITCNSATTTVLGLFSTRNKADTTDYDKTGVTGWNIDNMFRHIVNYISDNEVSYYSQYLTTNYLDYSARLFCTSGYNLRNGSNRNIECSLKQLYEATRKLLNVVMYFTATEDGRGLRIEDAQTIANKSVGLNFTDIQNVSMNFDQSSYYSAVKVGNTKAIQNNTEIGTSFNFPKIEGATFATETFAVNRDCNVNNVLDLVVSDFIYDHNIFEDVFVNNNIEYDEELFLIQCTNTGAVPVRSDYLGISADVNSSRGFYNQDLLNNRVIARNDIYGELIKHHKTSTDTFLAYNYYGDVYTNFPVLTSAVVGGLEYDPVQLSNDYATVTLGSGVSSTPFDNNNLYNNSKPYAYVCPSTGYYKFTTSDTIVFTPPIYSSLSNTGNNFHFYSILTVKDSGGTITQQKVFKWRVQKYYDNGFWNLARGVQFVGVSYGGAGAPEQWVNIDASATNGNGSVTESLVQAGQNTGYEIISYGAVISTDNDLYLNVGDYVEHWFVMTESDGWYYNNENDGSAPAYTLPRFANGSGTEISYRAESFACTKATNGGNVELKTKDGSGKLRRLEFDTFITDVQYRSLFNNSQMKIGASLDGNNYQGKIMKAVMDHKNNICKFTLKLD